MVIVTHPILVASCRPGGLDAPEHTHVGQHADGVVHRPRGDRADVGPDELDHLVGGEMRPARHRSQYGQTLRRDLEPTLAKQFSEVGGHICTLCKFPLVVKTVIRVPSAKLWHVCGRVTMCRMTRRQWRHRSAGVRCVARRHRTDHRTLRSGHDVADRRQVGRRPAVRRHTRLRRRRAGTVRCSIRRRRAFPTCQRSWRSCRW